MRPSDPYWTRMTRLTRKPGTTRTAPRRGEIVPMREPSTDRIYMRPLVRSDQGVVVEALERSRESLRRWIPLEAGHENVYDYFDRLVEMGAKGDRTGTAQRRAVFTHDDTFVGVVNLIKITRGLEWSAEVLAWFDVESQGQGLGTHAIGAMVDYACADLPIGLGLHKVLAHICVDNTASLNVATRLGFVPTGRSDVFEVNGALIRHHEFVCEQTS